MALGKHRVAQVGETPYAHEKEAIDFAIGQLPNVDPYHLWALIDLVEPSSGRLYEIDLLIIGYSAIYLVEAKGGPGLYEGDSVDWLRTPGAEAHPASGQDLSGAPTDQRGDAPEAAASR